MPEFPDTLQASLGGSYRIVRDLGGGGMSHVYVAHDASLDREIVVKVLHRDLADAVNVERFSREIRLAARLSHPHIVPLLTAGESGGLPFYTMPLVNGLSLRDRLKKEGALRVVDTVRILRDVASALGYAHEQGVVHRDIKPDNILLSGDSASVTDFGVAKALSASSRQNTMVTSLGVTLGTPAYMSPEQAVGDPNIDGRSDVYALGVVAFEMLGGQSPFHGRTLQATLAAHIHEPPPEITALHPGLPAPLARLIMRCLAKDPNDRPQTAGEFVRALDELSNPSLQTTPAVIAAMTPTTTPAVVPPSSLDASTKGQRVMSAKSSIMAVTAAVAAAAFWWFLGGGAESPQTSQLASALNTARGGAPTSVAVLAFGGGSDTADTYLREGMAEQIMGALGKGGRLRVASRMSAFAFEGRTDVSAADIGKQLKVQNVLEGSMRREGERLRVFVQLTSVKDGIGVWSEKFDFVKTDVFSVQDSISRAVLARLGVSKTVSAATPAQSGTKSLEAYDLYLRARYLFNKFDEAPLRESITLYDQALQRDPRYADAWAGIALSWLFLADDYVAPNIAYPAARKAAERALAIDSSIADAHAARGSALFQYDWQFAEGRREVERAVALAPQSFIALISTQALFIALAQPDSALSALQKGQETDPLSPLNALLLGRFLGIVGRYDEAIAQYRRVVELAPPLAPIALLPIAEAQIAQGKKSDGEATLTQVRGMLPPPLHFLLANAEAALGNENTARVLLTRYEEAAKQRYVRPELIATVYAKLGDKNAAFAWLEKSFTAHSPYLFALAVDKQWEPLRGDPRFTVRVQRMAKVTAGTP